MLARSTLGISGSYPDSLSKLTGTLLLITCTLKHTCIHIQDFELELAGAHVMRVQICSKSLLKEETYAHGKIRVCVLRVIFAIANHLLWCCTCILNYLVFWDGKVIYHIIHVAENFH